MVRNSVKNLLQYCYDILAIFAIPPPYFRSHHFSNLFLLLFIVRYSLDSHPGTIQMKDIITRQRRSNQRWDLCVPFIQSQGNEILILLRASARLGCDAKAVIFWWKAFSEITISGNFSCVDDLLLKNYLWRFFSSYNGTGGKGRMKMKRMLWYLGRREEKWKK